jgi:hypothetical protein
MKSRKLGPHTSAEVSNVSATGFWLLIADKERFLPFADFPWFREARIRELTNVELQSPNHLYWPDLDVDLSVESIDHPERFPLVSRVHSITTPPRPKRTQRKSETERGSRPAAPKRTVVRGGK